MNLSTKTLRTLGVGIVAGSLVGVGAALLSEPESGARTRALLIEKSRTALSSGQGLAGTAFWCLRGKAGEAISRVTARRNGPPVDIVI